MHARGAQRHDRVAVDDFSVLVDEDHAISVTVQGYAQVSLFFFTSAATCSGCRAPQLRLMFTPFGLQPSAITSASQLGEDGRCDAVGRAVRRIDDDFEAVERQLFGKVFLA